MEFPKLVYFFNNLNNKKKIASKLILILCLQTHYAHIHDNVATCIMYIFNIVLL